jgi:hypothetical protein
LSLARVLDRLGLDVVGPGEGKRYARLCGVDEGLQEFGVAWSIGLASSGSGKANPHPLIQIGGRSVGLEAVFLCHVPTIPGGCINGGSAHR